MAVNTDLTLRHQVIYSVFVRGHTKEGTFRALEGDLDRLNSLADAHPPHRGRRP